MPNSKYHDAGDFEFFPDKTRSYCHIGMTRQGRACILEFQHMGSLVFQFSRALLRPSLIGCWLALHAAVSLAQGIDPVRHATAVTSGDTIAPLHSDLQVTPTAGLRASSTPSTAARLPSATGPANPSVAFFYGANPPMRDLQAFDIAVVEPDFVADPRMHARSTVDGVHSLFAYVSLGEVQPSRRYYGSLPAATLRTDNPAWGSRVVDQSAPGWQEFFLSQVIAPLWEKGWRGFFIDTLDSYQLFCTTDEERAVQVRALVGTLRELKRRYPDARLILNRGFELLPEISSLVEAVAAESLYQGYDAGRQQYHPVAPGDRQWLLGQMQMAHEHYRLPVISIEYVAPEQPDARLLARTTAAQIRQHGFVPWVADGALGTLGVGSVEVLPRTVLILVDNLNHDVFYTTAQRFLGMPLNYLGLRYEFVDLQSQPLPDVALAGRYAGVVTWLNVGADHPGLAAWFKRQADAGVPLAVFDTFGFALDARIAAGLGLELDKTDQPSRLSVGASDPVFVGFEAPAIADRSAFQPLRLRAGQGRSLLGLQDQSGARFDAVALTTWGGFALSPFTTRTLPTLDQNRWILQPIAFLQAALRLPAMPMPDVTTEGGQRILTAHVDADGFASRAELPGTPFAATVMEREFIGRYQIPTAVSVIEGELSTKGVFANLSPQLEPIARRLFSLPNVEAASHSYSHPFNWAKAMRLADNQEEGAVDKSYGLPLPGYRFDIVRDIQGSIDYINDRLLPVGKKVRLFLWSGNAVAPPGAIAQTVRSGVLNMNGGDTVITESNKSWTAIAANGVRKDAWYQVFAPNQNENVYTRNWTGPFYGFERALETYRLTGAPLRFKPVDIYYHVYSASKPASILALHKVYDWAVAQPFTRIFPSQYAQKVLDFEATSIARDLITGELVVRTGESLRTLRLPVGSAVPSLADSRGVAGVTSGPSGDYLTLAAAEVRLSPRPNRPGDVYLSAVNGAVSDLQRQIGSRATKELRFSVTANDRIDFTLANAAGCTVGIDDQAPVAESGAGPGGRAHAGSMRYREPAERLPMSQSGRKAEVMSIVRQRHVLVRCPG